MKFLIMDVNEKEEYRLASILKAEGYEIQTAQKGEKALGKKITELEIARPIEKAMFDELEMLFNSAADGMLIIDKDFNIVRMNDTYERIFGILSKDALGKKCYDFSICPRCHTENCSMTKAIKYQTRFEMNIDRKTRDGNSIPCLVTVIPHRDPDGQVIGIVESYRDISAIRQAETQLQLIKDLIDQSNDAVLVADFDTGFFTYVNERACINLGYTVEELLKMRMMDIFFDYF